MKTRVSMPESLMLFMYAYTKTSNFLTDTDRKYAIQNKWFKDNKAISNALYQLKKAGYVDKIHHNIWMLNESGIEALDKFMNPDTQASEAPRGPKPEEWNDELDFVDEDKEEIARLLEENKELRIEVKIVNEFYERLKAYSSDQGHYIGELIKKNTELEAALHALHDKYAPLEQSIEAFTAGAKIFSDIAKRFS